MTILSCPSETCPSETPSTTYPDDTPENFARLLDYIDIRCRWYSRRTRYAYEDYQDYASHLMASVLEKYDPTQGHSLVTCMWQYMKWRLFYLPLYCVDGRIIGRHEKPHAHCLRRSRHEKDPWLRLHIEQHWDCLTPVLQRTVRDYLADEPPEDIAARDGITLDQVRARRCALVAWFRRHVYQRETSCIEEQEGTALRMRDRPSATGRPSRRIPGVKRFHADRLRTCMQETGKHSGVLRQLLRVDQSQVTRWMNGKFNPPQHHVDKLAVIFGKPVSYFTEDRDDIFEYAAAD